MKCTETMKKRRSIRNYKEEKIDPKVIEEIIEASRFSPSWKNTQITRYNLVESEEVRKELAQNCVMGFTFNTKTMLQAPALMVLSYVTKRCGYERDGSFSTSKEDAWEMFDVGIAAQSFCLAAYEKGIGTCMLGIFDEEKVAKVLGLADNEKVGVLIALGYPAEDATVPKRKEVSDLLRIH